MQAIGTQAGLYTAVRSLLQRTDHLALEVPLAHTYVASRMASFERTQFGQVGLLTLVVALENKSENVGAEDQTVQQQGGSRMTHSSAPFSGSDCRSLERFLLFLDVAKAGFCGYRGT